MNTKSVISGLMAVCMMASAPAFAQRYDYGHDRNDQVQRQNDYNRDYNRDQYRSERHERYRGNNEGHAYYGARNDGYRYQMRRGERLPEQYRGSRYVVSDWRGRHLSAPPRGYQWVQANNDYVLAAIAPGLIAQVLLNN